MAIGHTSVWPLAILAATEYRIGQSVYYHSSGHMKIAVRGHFNG